METVWATRARRATRPPRPRCSRRCCCGRTRPPRPPKRAPGRWPPPPTPAGGPGGRPRPPAGGVRERSLPSSPLPSAAAASTGGVAASGTCRTQTAATGTVSLKKVADATPATNCPPSAGITTTCRPLARSGAAGSFRLPDGGAPPPRGGASTSTPPGANAHSVATTAPEPPPNKSKTRAGGGWRGAPFPPTPCPRAAYGGRVGPPATAPPPPPYLPAGGRARRQPQPSPPPPPPRRPQMPASGPRGRAETPSAARRKDHATRRGRAPPPRPAAGAPPRPRRAPRAARRPRPTGTAGGWRRGVLPRQGGARAAGAPTVRAPPAGWTLTPTPASPSMTAAAASSPPPSPARPPAGRRPPEARRAAWLGSPRQRWWRRRPRRRRRSPPVRLSERPPAATRPRAFRPRCERRQPSSQPLGPPMGWGRRHGCSWARRWRHAGSRHPGHDWLFYRLNQISPRALMVGADPAELATSPRSGRVSSIRTCQKIDICDRCLRGCPGRMLLPCSGLPRAGYSGQPYDYPPWWHRGTSGALERGQVPMLWGDFFSLIT